MSSCAQQSQHQPSPPLTTFSDTPQYLPKLVTTDLQSSTQGDGSRGLQCLTKLQLRSCHTRAEFCTSPSVCWCQVAEAPGEAFPRVTDRASLSTGNPPHTQEGHAGGPHTTQTPPVQPTALAGCPCPPPAPLGASSSAWDSYAS